MRGEMEREIELGVSHRLPNEPTVPHGTLAGCIIYAANFEHLTILDRKATTTSFYGLGWNFQKRWK